MGLSCSHSSISARNSVSMTTPNTYQYFPDSLTTAISFFLIHQGSMDNLLRWNFSLWPLLRSWANCSFFDDKCIFGVRNLSSGPMFFVMLQILRPWYSLERSTLVCLGFGSFTAALAVMCFLFCLFWSLPTSLMRVPDLQTGGLLFQSRQPPTPFWRHSPGWRRCCKKAQIFWHFPYKWSQFS